MSKHTPGPWLIDSRCSTHVVALTRPICSAGGYANNSVPSDDLASENNANARLIAAAPEMLDMLTEAHNQIEYLSEKFGETGTSNTMCARIRHLIAKAEGRS